MDRNDTRGVWDCVETTRWTKMSGYRQVRMSGYRKVNAYNNLSHLCNTFHLATLYLLNCAPVRLQAH